jgi:cytochrome c-type biogenesis protein CcmE
MSRRFRLLLPLVFAAIAFAIIAYGQIGENLVYYWGPADVQAAGPRAVGATIRLGGMVVPASIQREGDGSVLRFMVTDRRAQLTVRTTGVPPQMFREGIGVVVEGTMTSGGHFEGHRLMVSHDNNYRAPGEDPHASQEVQALIQSTQGLSEEAP